MPLSDNVVSMPESAAGGKPSGEISAGELASLTTDNDYCVAFISAAFCANNDSRTSAGGIEPTLNNRS